MYVKTWYITCICVYVCVWVRVCTHICGWLYIHTWAHVCNDKTETRDALQLLVPSDEAESSSDRFYLPCLNLNLPGCGMSNSLRTNGISQTSSKMLFFYFSAVTKGFKHAPTQAARDLTFLLLFECLLYEAMHYKCLGSLLQGSQCWHKIQKGVHGFSLCFIPNVCTKCVSY